MLEMELQCTQDPGAMEPGMDMEFWRIHPPGRDTWAHGMKVQFSFWRYHIRYPLDLSKDTLPPAYFEINGK